MAALALSSLSDSDWAARAPTEQQLRFIGGVGAARRWQMCRSATMLDVPECYAGVLCMLDVPEPKPDSRHHPLLFNCLLTLLEQDL